MAKYNKSWDNILWGATVGIGLLAAIGIARFANNLAGQPLDLRLSSTNVSGAANMYDEYGYVEEVNPQPTGIDLLLRADDRYNEGINYAYPVMTGQADLRTSYLEDDLNNIGPYNVTEPQV